MFHHHFVYPPHRTCPFIMVSVSKVRSARDASASLDRLRGIASGGRTRSRSAGHDSFGGVRAAHERHGAPARVAQQAGSPALPEGAGAPDLRVNARTGH